MAKKDKNDDLYYQKISRSASRAVNRSIFCSICGKEILLYNQPQDMYEWEKQHQVHVLCARNRAIAARQPKK